MTQDRLATICETLIEAVTRGAVEVLRVRQSGGIGAEYKDANELVTRADRQSDAVILATFRERLTALDPGIGFTLEESGDSGPLGSKVAGADPLDGTSHFACGGNQYSVQAHYMEDGVPLVGVVFQPEVYLPIEETSECLGRLSWGTVGQGAFVRRSTFRGESFEFGTPRRLWKRQQPSTKTFTACVPLSTKMSPEERERAARVLSSGIIASIAATGGAGGNVLMTVLGGQQVYANFGAGNDLDLIPPQVIACEAGMTVWDIHRRTPVWQIRKQPFVVAPSPEVADIFFRAAGL